jgi:hypothetical protein
MGFQLVIRFIERLQNVITNNCDSLTQLHTPKITVTTAHIKSSQFAISSPVVVWWRIPAISSAFVLTFLPAGDCLTTNSLLQLSTLSWLSLIVLLITSRHVPHRKHNSSLAVSNCCHADMLVCDAFTQWRLLYSCFFRGRCLTTGLNATIFISVLIFFGKTFFQVF